MKRTTAFLRDLALYASRVALAGVFIFAATALCDSKASADEVLTFSGCNGKTAEVKLTYFSRVILNAGFVGKKQPEQQFVAAVRHQLNYGFGELLLAPTPELSVKPSSNEPEITILETKKTLYPFDLEIAPVRSADVEIDSTYILKALKRGRTARTDAAFEISYRASFTAIICSHSGEGQPTVHFDLPLDPYLFYWAVPQSEFRPISWRQSSFTINPCADPELADLPHPFYFWYFWNPRQKGKDSNDKPFDCAELLREGTDYLTVSPAVELSRTAGGRSAIFQLDALKASPNIRASVFFGIIDEKAKTALSIPPVNLAALIEGKSVAEAGMFTGPPAVGIDRGSQYFISFLRKLSEVMDVESSSVAEKSGGRRKKVKSSNHVQLHVSGKLRGSGKPIELEIFFGYTDIFGHHPAAHWEAAEQSLQKSDLVMYVGHSGLGGNMALENILTRGGKSRKRRLNSSLPPYQLIAYFSCYSWSYFGPDTARERLRRLPASITDVVFAGSEFTSERGPLGTLHFIDLYLSASVQTVNDLINAGYLAWSDFIVVESFTKDATNAAPDRPEWIDNRPPGKPS